MWPLEPNLQYFLAVCGLTVIITESALFSQPRALITAKSKWLGKLVSCAMCFGFWAGVIIFLGDYFLSLDMAYLTFRAGLMASGVCWIVRVVLAKLGSDQL